MSDEIKTAVAEAMRIVREEEAKETAEKARLESIKEEGRKAGYEAGLKEGEEKGKAWAQEHGATTMNIAKLGSGGEEGDIDAFYHWMKTGDEVVARKALQEDTGSEGGFFVPSQVEKGILPLRDNASFVRQSGIRIIPTSLKQVDVPAESTRFADFTRTAEEAAYTTNDPAFAQNTITVYKWTKVTKVSDELLQDSAGQLDAWYGPAVARAMAATECAMVASGTGTNQHTGIFIGGDTDGITYVGTGSSDSPDLDDVTQHFMTLKSGYHADAFWLCGNLMWGKILGKSGTNVPTFNPNASFISVVDRPAQVGVLMGKPVFVQEDLSSGAASTNVLFFGSAMYYGLAERQGLSVVRNPYLYQANGQVGFFATFRQGGKVLAAEAWIGGLTAA